MKQYLLIAGLVLAGTTAVHAQKPKRLKGKALADSTMAAYQAKLDKGVADFKVRLDSMKNAREAKKAIIDNKNGFRDYHFNDDISQHPTLVKVSEDGDSKTYRNPKENLKIGQADLKDVRVNFYKGKLTFILVQTETILNSSKVKEALEAQYGPGFQGNKYLPEYAWLGNRVAIIYTENSISHDAVITYSDREMTAQEEAGKKAAAKKAGSDL